MVITEYTIYEVYALGFLEHFLTFFDHTIDGLLKIRTQEQDLENTAAIFTDTYRSALLKACVTLV